MGNKNTEQSRIESVFVKDGFLYNVYSEENVGACESEVTQYAVKIYQKYYKPYQDGECWLIGNDGNELGKRAQMSTKGCFLTRNSGSDKKYIDIAGDILTSSKKPLKKCFEISGLSEEDFQCLCKLCCPDCIQEKIRETAGGEKNDKSDENYEKVVRSAAAFVLVSHTIGNMMPIPEGLNTRWYGPDCIGYKVGKLRKYLENQTDKKIDKETEKDIGIIKKYIKAEISLGYNRTEKAKKIGAIKPEGIIGKWYRQEGITLASWKKFVEDNYLQDVFRADEEKSYNSYDNVREDIIMLPKSNKNLEGWSIWFDTMTELIVRRGWRIMNEGKAIEKEELDNILDLLQISNK